MGAVTAPAVTLLTVGHGTLDADAFVEVVRQADVATVVDVRRYPGSRRHPHFGREAMSDWLLPTGVTYRWIEALGGRRSPAPDSPNLGLRNAQFRAYADHMASPSFAAGVSELLAVASGGLTAVMCAESVWWRCHRRLLADHLVLVESVPVGHLLHDGRVSPHEPTPSARRSGHHVVYDAAATTTP